MIAKPFRVSLFALCLGAGLILSCQNHFCGELSRAATKHRSSSRTKTDIRRGVPGRPAFSLPAAFSLPVTFTPNDPSSDGAQFIGRGMKSVVCMTRDGIAFGTSRSRARDEAVTLQFSMRDGDARRRLRWKGIGKLRGESNFLIGDDPGRWRTRVPHFERVGATFAGIGIVVYGKEGSLEYDLQIPPGVDASKLRLAFGGASEVRTDGNGGVVVKVNGAELRMGRPKVYEILAASAQTIRPRYRTHRAPGARRDRLARRNRPRRNAGPRPDRPRGRDFPSTRRRTRKGGRSRSSEHIKQGWPRQRREQQLVDVSYAIEEDGAVGFRVVGRNPRATLLIDPSISVVYSRFLGGTGAENATSIVVDSTGKIYVGGTTTAPTTFAESSSQLGPGIPTASGANSGSEPEEFFVAKIDPTQSGANSLVYLTFLGGSANQAGGLIAVDVAGNVAITGTTTSSDFPVTDGSAQKSGSNSTVVSELDATGSKLVYSALFGGNGEQSMQAFGGIAVDKTGNIFVASDTNSSNLPATSGGYAIAYQSTSNDGFLAVFQPGATPHLKYCSYLGLNAQVGIGGIAVDASGNAYIAGSTSSPLTAFPAKNAYQSAYAGGDFDAFLMKLSPGGEGAADLIYATLLGGSGSDQAFAVAVDSETPPKAYVTGTTGSTNFPANGAVAAYQSSLPYNATTKTSDAFLSVIAQNGAGQTSLAYSTYLGGTQIDVGYGVTAVQPWAVYVTGAAKSWDFPWRDNFQPFNGYGNAFVAKLDTTSAGAASLLYSTPLGGTSPPGATPSSQGSAIALDASGDVWAAGQTSSADFPSAGNPGNGFQPVCASCQQSPASSDAFIVKIHESSAQLPSLYFAAPAIPLNFGKQQLGAINIPLQFAAIKNGGDAALSISSLGIIGPNSSDFSLSGAGNCAPATISPGNMCSFEVGFIPSKIGAEGAFVAVTSNAPGSPQVLQLVGTGVGLAALPASLDFGPSRRHLELSAKRHVDEYRQRTALCRLCFRNASGSPQTVALSGTAQSPATVQITPQTLTFSAQSVGTKSAAQQITITDSSTNLLAINGVAVSGTNAADFSQTNNCPASLGASASCMVNVVFQPAASGTRTASISISDDAADSPQSVALNGAGTAPAIALSPSSVNFGNQAVATASAAVTITVSNSGTGALIIGSISFSGTNAADFTETDNCAGSAAPNGVAPGASCAIQVVFKPACSNSASARAASLSLSDNAAGSPQAVALSGNGTGSFCFVVPAGSSTSATISPGQTANYALQVGAANGFAGSIAFTCVGAPTAATCTVTPTPVTLGGSALANVTVNVATTGTGAAAAWRMPGADAMPRTSALALDRTHRGWQFEMMLPIVLVVLIALVMSGAQSPSIVGRAAAEIPEYATRRFLRLSACACLVALCFAACGGGGGTTPPNDPGTPVGNYTLTLTGTPSGGSAQSIALSLNVR